MEMSLASAKASKGAEVSLSKRWNAGRLPERAKKLSVHL